LGNPIRSSAAVKRPWWSKRHIDQGNEIDGQCVRFCKGITIQGQYATFHIVRSTGGNTWIERLDRKGTNTMNTATAFLDEPTTKEDHIGIAMAGSVLITALVMVAAVRWAASDSGYASLLTSLVVAGGSSFLICFALWMLPGNEQPRPSPTGAQPVRA
jgi:hypothetical protein